MLWQSAYAEMVFLDTLWPDFSRDDLWQAIELYAGRDRRFGGAVDAPDAPDGCRGSAREYDLPRHPFAFIVSEPIKIDIWSDIACPWCYIGKRKFEAARRARRRTSRVEVEYHSFELSPDTPVDFEGSEVDFLARHKGMPAEQVQQMLERVTGIAANASASTTTSTRCSTRTR